MTSKPFSNQPYRQPTPKTAAPIAAPKRINPNPPPHGIALSCPAGQQEFAVAWDPYKFQNNVNDQTMTLSNGMAVTVKNYDTGNAKTTGFALVNINAEKDKGIFFQTTTTVKAEAVIAPGGQPTKFPSDFGTMEIEFPVEMQNREYNTLLLFEIILTDIPDIYVFIFVQSSSLLAILTQLEKSLMPLAFVWLTRMALTFPLLSLQPAPPMFSKTLVTSPSNTFTRTLQDGSLHCTPRQTEKLKKFTLINLLWHTTLIKLACQQSAACFQLWISRTVPRHLFLLNNVSQIIHNKYLLHHSFGAANRLVYSKDSCSEISSEDFEGGAPGWTNGKTEHAAALTNFLGRYAKDTPQPEKTYNIASDAKSATIDFDFYQIDSWSAPDNFGMSINGKYVDFGQMSVLENVRPLESNAKTDDGITWTIKSSELKELAFMNGHANWREQSHAVSVQVPEALLAGGKLTIKFHANTNENHDNESAGIDNLKIRVCAPEKPVVTPDQQHSIVVDIPKKYYEVDSKLELTLHTAVEQPLEDESSGFDNFVFEAVFENCRDHCEPTEVIAWEDFEGGAAPGWAQGDGSVASVQPSDTFSKFLGRLGGSDVGTNQVSKTYEGLPTDAPMLKLSYDMYELDSWDVDERWAHPGGDKYFVEINDKVIDFGAFGGNLNDYKKGEVDGIQWTTHFINAPTNLGFFQYNDQKHDVILTIPQKYYADGKLTIKFRTYTDEILENESLGIDNLMITREHDGCQLETCEPAETISYETFEDGKALDWIDGTVDHSPKFSHFLGRFGKGKPSTSKYFEGIPTDAEELTLRFDLYEIDSWYVYYPSHLMLFSTFPAHPYSSPQG